MIDIDISIIICCYNSEDRIIATLEHILNQQGVDSTKIEVILVDNNSTDNTNKIANEFWKKCKTEITFQIVREDRPGLSFARKKGALSANGEFIIFCDDDNWLDRLYVKTALKSMRMNPQIGVLGGIGYPVLESEKPDWFEKYKLIYAVGPQARKSGDITFSNGYVYGAGCVIRKNALLDLYKIGFENLLRDRKKNTLSSGGDCEICYNIAFYGFKIFYNDQLKFQHFIPSQRLTIDYLKRFRKGQAAAYDIIKSYEKILFSKGSKRRGNYERVEEIKEFLLQLLRILYKKNRNKMEHSEYIFSYCYIVNVLRVEILNWNVNSKMERQIHKFHQKIKLMGNSKTN